MSAYHWLFVVVVYAALRCNGQRYICDNDENNYPACECKEAVCYFKLVIEHLQVRVV